MFGFNPGGGRPLYGFGIAVVADDQYNRGIQRVAVAGLNDGLNNGATVGGECDDTHYCATLICYLKYGGVLYLGGHFFAP